MTRSFCYIADATIDFFTVLLKADSFGAWNVSSKREESLSTLAKMILDIDGKSSSKVIKNYNNKEIKSPVERSAFCIKKIEKLGWKDKTTLEEGLERTIKFHRS